MHAYGKFITRCMCRTFSYTIAITTGMILQRIGPNLTNFAQSHLSTM